MSERQSPENDVPEWLGRACPVCRASPGWGCSDVSGRRWQQSPHAARIIQPASTASQPGD